MKNKINDRSILSFSKNNKEDSYLELGNKEEQKKILLTLKEIGFQDVKIESTDSLTNLSLVDLLDDEDEQIILSKELFNAFIIASRGKKNYNDKKIYDLFKNVVFLYNDTIQSTDKFGALTYLQRIANLLDYLEISNIMELSIEQLNKILEIEDVNLIQKTYEDIKKKRYKLTFREFNTFMRMLKNSKSNKIDVQEAKNVYKYISNIYNENPILQDNINYIEYLEKFSKINTKTIASMRMYQILEVFKIQNIIYENINEGKKLVNDLTTNTTCFDSMN